MATHQEQKEQQRNRWSSFSAGWDRQHELLGRQNAGVSEWLCREAGIGAGMS